MGWRAVPRPHLDTQHEPSSGFGARKLTLVVLRTQTMSPMSPDVRSFSAAWVASIESAPDRSHAASWMCTCGAESGVPHARPLLASHDTDQARTGETTDVRAPTRALAIESIRHPCLPSMPYMPRDDHATECLRYAYIRPSPPFESRRALIRLDAPLTFRRAEMSQRLGTLGQLLGSRRGKTGHIGE